MANKKRGFILATLILSFIFIAILVIAATTEQNAKYVSPAQETNHSSGLSLVNFTFQNGTAGVDVETHIGLLNATIYYNITPTEWGIIANTTQCTTFAGGVTNVSCWGSLNLSVNGSGSIIPDGYYKLNATIRNGSVLAEEYRQGIGEAGNLTTIRIDTTQPEFISWPTLTSGNNHSTISNTGNLTLNVSANDTLSGIGTVMFFFINETGSLGGNASVTGIREGTRSTYSTSINLSHLLDGTYNVTLLINDTAGNHNTTVNTSTVSTYILTKIKVDNTVPVASPACSNVDEGSAFPCTCSGSDTLSGVNSTSGSSTSPNGVAVPTSTGSFTYTCTATDRAGNTASSSAAYTISSGGATSSGSGSSGSSSGSSGSSGSTDPNATSGTSGTGATGAGGTGAQGTGTSSSSGEGSSNTALIVSIIVVLIVIAAVTIYMRRRK